ncbi:phosphoenolpyruvate synthase [Aliiroseovarius sp. KMU-50]|uniref:Phosphoenolpyruvate synthase n=1 Tax=Aliiroseovarius salicola TaxID=3009082 RepID=A0ABT4VX92_9RHOB|nr:phosphoenolpyruvate synthase [Aliiroseovarius sp. KMU-50]MDA5092841.1 phosphoenolpyruvate synthase [Aliiroseovarius sp. KMU-50]
MTRAPKETSSMLIWLDKISRSDIAKVGGKNASLGEMLQSLADSGIRVPPGFATTADAYRSFISANGLDQKLREVLSKLDANRTTLASAGQEIRTAISEGVWPDDIESDIRTAYRELGVRVGLDEPSVAVRSSATAEDLPDASFAGQQETFLNVQGEEALLSACKNCLASLFTDRAITYRQIKGFDHLEVALSVGVQHMVRSDQAGSGVMFSIDTESGFDKVVLINAAWGLGENVVQGHVDPDEYQVYKPFLEQANLIPIVHKALGAKEIKMIYGHEEGAPTRNVPTSKAERSKFVLSDPEILELARAAIKIEAHYGVAMDIEWAKDGETGQMYIVQARPETVQSRREADAFKTYRLDETGERLLTGLSVGNSVASGEVCMIQDSADMDRFVDGGILVTSNTDPDWVPIMKRAAAIVTDHGGRTSHAAIVSRELGVPAIVGTSHATEILHDGQLITVSCAEGETGIIYAGKAQVTVEERHLNQIPSTRTNVMLNLANPAAALRWWRLPADGVGLARMEFVINNEVQVHPLALTRFEELTDTGVQNEIDQLTRGYENKTDYFVKKLAMGLSRIAATWYPNPTIIRMSDFKTNEYADLLGGRQFEPAEENPMIGFRGASRYYDDAYRDGFALECQAIRHLREAMGFDNVIVMIPFCRTVEEAERVLSIMADHGLERGKNGLQVYVMCEIPSNVIEAEAFAERFDGFSIGSNDLTQLTLGVDRDSAALAHLFSERDPAVLWMIETVINKAHSAGRKVGLCGQAPSNDPDFARLLVQAGIDTISVTPDSFFAVKENVADAEAT